MVEYVFPLHARPRLDFGSGGRQFGARRSNGKRKHAGCDLKVPPGTPVVSMAHGRVTRGPYAFYSGTYALEVTHADGRVVRYGEIKRQVPAGIHEGAEVRQGQVIAFVGQLGSGNSMLHLEMYEGSHQGRLTQAGANAFGRRADLLNPAPWLKAAPLVSEVPNVKG